MSQDERRKTAENNLLDTNIGIDSLGKPSVLKPQNGFNFRNNQRGNAKV